MDGWAAGRLPQARCELSTEAVLAPREEAPSVPWDGRAAGRLPHASCGLSTEAVLAPREAPSVPWTAGLLGGQRRQFYVLLQ